MVKLAPIFYLMFGILFSASAETKTVTLSTNELPCFELLNPEAAIIRRNLDKSSLTQFEPNYITIVSKGINPEGQIELFKAKGMKWASLARSNAGGFTPQGDPRWFIHLAGIELAQHFTFEMEELQNGILLRVPGANKLKHRVLAVNKILIRKGLDPIVYLPVRTGFVSALTAVKLFISTEEPFLVYAPYADDNRDLVMHEVAWHLGPLLFPKKFHEKSKEIDLEILKLADRLNKSGLPHATEVASRLIDIRALELDAGNANITANLATERQNEELNTYKSFLSKKSEGWGLARSSINKAIQYIARPGLTAEVVAIQHLQNLLFHNERQSNKSFEVYRSSNLELPLHSAERELYKPWLQKIVSELAYVELTPADTADVWLNELLEYMDNRINELNIAFREADAENL